MRIDAAENAHAREIEGLAQMPAAPLARHQKSHSQRALVHLSERPRLRRRPGRESVPLVDPGVIVQVAASPAMRAALPREGPEPLSGGTLRTVRGGR
jgi:hypothetical protein